MTQEKSNEDLIKDIVDIDFIRFCFSSMSDKSNEYILSNYSFSGWKDGIDPNSKFSNNLYLTENEDVRAEGIDPLKHYLEYGIQEGRISYLSQWGDNTADKVPGFHLGVIFQEFDPAYYKKYLPELSVLSDESVASHFLVIGWKNGLDPSPHFSVKDYLNNNKDVSDSGINPLVHSILNKSKVIPDHNNLFDESLQADIETVLEYFDATYYRMMNPDLRGSDLYLVEHYMQIGWKERRDPSPTFSTSYYLDNYPDIAASGSNPLLHYVIFGKSEGRRPRGDEPLRLIYNPKSSITPNNMLAVINSVLSNSTQDFPCRNVNPNKMIIHWVIPDFSKGSGGHMTIFRMVNLLESFGHTCRIWIENSVFNKTSEEAWENIVKYFQCVKARVDFIGNDFYAATGDAVIATGWSTAYYVEKANGFGQKFYFVQDHEPEFYPTGAEYLLAMKTYEFDLGCICASPWLSKLMKERYGRWARSFDLAYDPSVYKVYSTKISYKAPNDVNNIKKIAVYSRNHTARRCVTLVLMALEQLGTQRDDFEVHFFGQENLDFNETNFRALNHGVLNSTQLSDLYNECHIGICFSATNYSLVPQEMMACGLPLIELNSKSTNEIFSRDIVTLAGPDPFDIASAISGLLDSEKKRKSQSEAALIWVNQFSWEKSARDVEQVILERLNIKKPQIKKSSISTIKKALIDVVIPTYNGINEIKPVIDSLRNQKSYDDIQIYCIDSSSSDGTTEWLKAQHDIALIIIPKKDFQHGRTRNFGAEQGTAGLIAFLTQDAVPVNQTWATDIIKMFGHCKNAAGLFGRHLAYQNHPLIVKQEIENHFSSMLSHPLQLSKDTDISKWDSGDQGWQMLLHFYSDNNSAMRRAIWNEIPYQNVDYGEDQLWAKEIIERGYTKIYAPSVCVYHSHDYGPKETYERAKTEAMFFYKYFGYKLGYDSEEDLGIGINNEQENFILWAKRNKVDDDDTMKGLENIRQKHIGLRDGRIEAMIII